MLENQTVPVSQLPQKNNKKTFLFGFAFVIVFAVGFFSGSGWYVRRALTDEKGDVEISKVLNLYTKTRSDSVEFDQFWNVWDIVKKNYYQQPVDDVDLFYGAIQGMVEGLGDPYSVYFPPEKAKEFSDDLSGAFEGVGAEIGLKNDQLIVIAPLPSSPAEKAGIKAGDKIFAIDDEETFGLSVDDAVQKIRGPKGSTVTLTISHNGIETVQEVTITRQTITVPTITVAYQPDGIAVLRLSYFNEDTEQEFNKAVTEIVARKPKGIVFDMRGNPGGFLDTAIVVASEWVTQGVVVKEQMTGQRETSYETVGRHRFAGIPTVVLVDGGSASASEIVAGALQDHGVAKLVGAKTFGKGSVQNFQPLPDGSALKLTVAHWLTPNGREINDKGIEPDIVVEKMYDENTKAPEGTPERVIDHGLEKAFETLRKK